MSESNRRLIVVPISAVLRLLALVDGFEVLAATLALAGLLVALVDGPVAFVVVSGLIVLAVGAVVGWREKRSADLLVPPGVGAWLMPRLLVTVAAVALLLPGPDEVVPAVAGGLLALAVLGETFVRAVSTAAQPYAHHLPGVTVRNHPVFDASRVFIVNVAATAVFLLIAIAPAPHALLLLPAAVAAAVTIASAADGVLRVRARQNAEQRLGTVLDDFGATFILYWEAPPGSSHQVGMWLPYLERLGRPFIVVLRTPRTFADVVRITNAPVLVRRYVSELDVLVTRHLKTAFFVNTAPRNAHMVHYLGVTQIQLNHGDSDKAPSYRRVFRMYDLNFVAGQAAIDRFATNGVMVPREMFEIVGRPQVEMVQVATEPISERVVKRVLYAPTWFGYLDDSRYSSVEIAPAIIEALLARGCVVVFRPHPWTVRTPRLAAIVEQLNLRLADDARTTGRRHQFGADATDGPVFDAFNAADALISDVSSVVPDFLYSEKPFAITAMNPGQTVEEFTTDFPLAKVGYVLHADLTDLDQVLTDLLDRDPHAAARRAQKTYYLGDFPAATYADGFLSAARRHV